MRSLLLLLFVSLAAHAVPRTKPQISVSRQLACGVAAWNGLDDRDEVACWDLMNGGKLLPPLPVDEPLQVAASERTVCVLELARLRCWEYVADKPQLKTWFSTLKQPYLIAAGANGKFCAYDHQRKLACSHLTTFGGPWHEPYALALGSGDQICGLEHQENRHILCVVPMDTNQSECEENLRKVDFYDPYDKFLALSRGNQVDCQACTLGGRDPHCWGDGREHRPGLHNTPLQLPSQLAFIQPPGADGHNLPCALDHNQIWCAGSPEAYRRVPLFPALTEALAFDGVDDRFCVINTEDWLCSVGGKNLPIHHGLSIRFGVERIDAELESLATRMYRDKASLTLAVVKALRERLGADSLNADEQMNLRLFTLIAIAPLIDDIDSSLFEATIQPKLHAALADAKQKYGKAAPSDFTRTPALTRLVLAALHGALDLLSNDSPAAHQRFQDLTVAIGNALAADGDTASIAELRKQASARADDFKAMVEAPRTRGTARFALGLLSVFGN